MDVPVHAPARIAAAGIPPDRRVVQRGHAVGPIPLPLRAHIHAGLHHQPVVPRRQEQRATQRDVEVAIARSRCIGQVGRVIEEAVRSPAVVAIDAHRDCGGRPRPIRIAAADINLVDQPTLSSRHQKVVATFGVEAAECRLELLGVDPGQAGQGGLVIQYVLRAGGGKDRGSGRQVNPCLRARPLPARCGTRPQPHCGSHSGHAGGCPDRDPHPGQNDRRCPQAQQ